VSTPALLAWGSRNSVAVAALGEVVHDLGAAMAADARRPSEAVQDAGRALVRAAERLQRLEPIPDPVSGVLLAAALDQFVTAGTLAADGAIEDDALADRIEHAADAYHRAVNEILVAALTGSPE
jgi:hypothetical protein